MDRPLLNDKQVDDELLDFDPGLNQLLVSPGSSISQLWTQDKWERHRGVSRYWRHLGWDGTR